jgi:hypothetical protein
MLIETDEPRELTDMLQPYFPDLAGRVQDPIHSGFAAQVDALVEQGGDTVDSVPGSWWPAWIDWLAPYCGPKVHARQEAGRRRVDADRGCSRELRAGEGLIGPVLRPGRG